MTLLTKPENGFRDTLDSIKAAANRRFFQFDHELFCNDNIGWPTIPEHFDHPLLKHMENLLDPNLTETHQMEMGEFEGETVMGTWDIPKSCRRDGVGFEDCVPGEVWEPRCETGETISTHLHHCVYLSVFP